MERSVGAVVAGIGIGCGGALAQNAHPVPADELKSQGFITTYLNNSGDIGGFAELRVNQGRDFRLQFLAEKPTLSDALSDASNYGIDLSLHEFGVNVGAGIRDGERDLSRIALRYRTENGDGIQFTYAQTPLREQLLIDGRLKLTEWVTAQAAIDDLGNFRARLLFEDAPYGLSIGGGKSDDEAVFNISAHSDRVWFLGSYGTERGAQARLVIGDIPKNRSDLAGGFTIPGANDISIYPDQTLRPALGVNPTFGRLALAPDAFLNEEPDSWVLDFGVQENVRVSGRANYRLGDLGALKNNWVSGGAYYDLLNERPGMTIEVGTKVFGGNIRVLGDLNEDQQSVGLLFTIPF